MKTTVTINDIQVKLDVALPAPVLIHKDGNSVILTADEVEMLRDTLNTMLELMEIYR